MENQCRSSDLIQAGTAVASAASILSQFEEWSFLSSSLSEVAQVIFTKVPTDELLKIESEKEEIIRRIQC